MRVLYLRTMKPPLSLAYLADSDAAIEVVAHSREFGSPSNLMTPAQSRDSTMLTPELISWQQPAKGTAPVPVVNGLEAALARALAAQSLLRDTGFVLKPVRSA